MDMTELLKMKLAQQQAPMNAAGEFAQTLGGILGQRGQRSFQQDAIRYFTQNGVTMDTINQFTSQYQGVDPIEVFKIAGTVANQKKAQDTKDAFKTIYSTMQDMKTKGEKVTQRSLTEKLPNVTMEQVQALGEFFKAYPDQKVEWVHTPEGGTTTKVVDGEVSGPSITGLAPKTTTSPLSAAIQEKMKQINPSTKKTYTADEAYKEIVNPAKEGSNTPHTETEYNADSTMERKVIWDGKQNKFVEMEGAIGKWHPVRSQVINVNGLKSQQTENIDDDGTLLTFVPNKGYMRPDGTPAHNAGKRVPAETLTSNATFDSLEQTAKNIMANPNWKKFVGPVDSRMARLRAATLGHKDFADFRAQVEQMIETSYALSGKQISEKEIKMLENLRGSIEQPDQTFQGAMDAYKRWLDQKKATRQEVFSSQGYNATRPEKQKVGRFIIEAE